MQLPTLALLTAVSLSKLAAAQFELGWQGNGLYAFCNAATDTCLGTIEDPITDGAPIVGIPRDLQGNATQLWYLFDTNSVDPAVGPVVLIYQQQEQGGTDGLVVTAVSESTQVTAAQSDLTRYDNSQLWHLQAGTPIPHAYRFENRRWGRHYLEMHVDSSNPEPVSPVFCSLKNAPDQLSQVWEIYRKV